MFASKKVGMDATLAAVSSELGGISTLKDEQTATLKVSWGGKLFLLHC